MATPWELLSAPSVPNSVQVLPLGRVPGEPWTLAAVQAAAVPAGPVSLQWPTPADVDPTGTWLTRSLHAEVGPTNPGASPISIAGLGVIDQAGAGQLLAVVQFASGPVQVPPGEILVADAVVIILA